MKNYNNENIIIMEKIIKPWKGGCLSLEDMDKAIEIMKAAREKETVMKEQEKESTNQTKDKRKRNRERCCYDTEENVNIDALFEDTEEYTEIR